MSDERINFINKLRCRGGGKRRLLFFQLCALLVVSRLFRRYFEVESLNPHLQCSRKHTHKREDEGNEAHVRKIEDFPQTDSFISLNAFKPLRLCF